MGQMKIVYDCIAFVAINDGQLRNMMKLIRLYLGMRRIVILMDLNVLGPILKLILEADCSMALGMVVLMLLVIHILNRFICDEHPFIVKLASFFYLRCSFDRFLVHSLP